MRALHGASHGLVRVVPETRAGRWSLGLLGPVALSLAVMDAALAAGYRAEGTFVGSWWLAAPVALVIITAAAAAATGGYAIVRRYEPALPVLLGTWMASCLSVFVLGWGGMPL